MSKYSGKCDIYDSFSGYTDEQLRKTRFCIGTQQIIIRNQRELAPFYPFLIGIHCADKNGGFVDMTPYSYVDAHEAEILTFYLDELKKSMRSLKRKKQEVTTEALLAKVSWNNNSYVRTLAERVAEHGNKATIEGISMDGIMPIYREELFKDMISMGYAEGAARNWVYDKGNSWNHSDIHKFLVGNTPKEDKLVKLITHDDLDGVACVILGKLAFGAKFDYITCQNGTINDTVSKHLNTDAIYDETHITDLSVSRALAQEIQDTRNNYFLMDHHRTALHLNDFSWCDVRVSLLPEVPGASERLTCGTELYYCWLVKNGYLARSTALDNFVKAVRDYDVWEWVNLGQHGKISEELNILLNEYGEYQFIEQFYAMLRSGLLNINNEDAAIIAAYKRREARAIEQKDKEMRRIVLGEYTIGVVYAEEHINIIGNTLCKIHPELDCIALVNCGHGGISFRTAKDDIDVSVIASKFGGGGHRAAAGAPLGEIASINLLQCIFGEECAVWVK